METGNNNRITTDLIWYVIRPFGIFVILYEIFAIAAAWTLPLFIKGFDGGDAYLISHTNDIYAVITAASMGLAGLPLIKTASTEIRYFEHRGKRKRPSNPTIFYAGMFVGVTALAFSLNIIMNLTGIVSSSDAAVQASSLTGSAMSVLGICVYGLFTPLIEEMVFRGIVYSRASRGAVNTGRYETVFPLLITSLAFAVYHANLPQGVYAFIMSIAFCLIYSVTEVFAAAYVMHAAINVMIILISNGGHGLFGRICTPAYAAAFAALALVSGYCVVRGDNIER